MMTLIQEGGFPMWFILLFGTGALGLATRYAVRAERSHLGPVWALALATLFASVAGTAAAFGAVAHNLTGQGRGEGISFQDPQAPKILLLGFGESMAPMIVGCAFLAVTALVAAVGLYKERR